MVRADLLHAETRCLLRSGCLDSVEAQDMLLPLPAALRLGQRRARIQAWRESSRVERNLRAANPMPLPEWTINPVAVTLYLDRSSARQTV
jgi:hypothetical protein